MSTYFKLIAASVFLVNLMACNSDSDDMLSSPVLSEPTNITTTSFRISWSSMGAEMYVVDVATDNGFLTPVAGYDAKETTSRSLIVTGLTHNTTYYYRVKAQKGKDFSEYSSTGSVTTLEEDDVVNLEGPLRTEAPFPVGVAVQANRLSGSYNTVIAREFNSITAEYEMKMNITHPTATTYNWGPADAMVKYAEDNNMQVHGHALIWHSSTPSWVENFSGTNQEFEDMIEEYITTVVTRYKGRIRSWDVVNEAIGDGGGVLRESVYKKKMGADYIAKCFQFAHAADPDAILFYNDYNIEFDATKQNAMLSLVSNLQSNNIPIHGVGFQMHISYNFPSKSTLELITKKVTDKNLLVHFSEVDVRVNPNNDQTTLTSERAELQRLKMKEMVEVFMGMPEASRYAITMWGLRDADTWLIDFWGQPDWPLLFNNDFTPKPAYTGFLQGL